MRDYCYYHKEELKKMVEYAINNVPYYCELIMEGEEFETAFKKLPFVEKNDVIMNLDIFKNNKIEDKKQIIESYTSGSTGKPMTVFWNSIDYLKSNLPLWKLRNKMGILPSDKRCQFHTFTNYKVNEFSVVLSPRILMENNDRTMSFSKLHLDDMNLQFYYDNINKFQPKWLFFQPSVASILCSFMEKNKLKPPKSIIYIELTGEFLYDATLRQISRVFYNANIRNHYGSQEFNCIAYECKNKNLHLVSDNVYLEIIGEDNSNRIGEICVSGLRNYKMPLIRYRLGDLGSIHDGKECECGNENPILRLKSGRKNDILCLPNGLKMEANIFYYIVQHINSVFNNDIIQFRIIQNTATELDINLCLQNMKNKNEIEKMFIEEINNQNISGLSWNFIYSLDWFLYDESGKLCYFEKKVKENE